MGTPVGDRNNLIMAAQTGDAAALSRLLAVCQADARRYAYKHCHASDVDDAVQESLLIISRKVSGLKAAAAFSSWLFTVIKHECRKLARMMFKHEPLPDEVAEELLLHRPDDELRIDLANALESLPAHYLEVVLLRDFEELTIAEIAAQLGEQPGAIKSRLHRARELVREYMLSSEPSSGHGHRTPTK
ncbi:sigma-70 family RNA polymerase sigma factor [Burkholderia vietnamiensis]|jgi:RNA polymerase sigma factor (sigma-70 family)|uniref:RNA polymerase sigma factor n=1 Tax=Burkholderia cenocepacia TaxID=95486 RepID=A0A6J5JXA4_9BURK|nr:MULTISPECIES: sigma-70 family RNA polymerase sigma factor [Pseudomonadota]HOV57440.1 sigma-70 family RNA polymerase sigma factor [Rhodanobacteraceae bacterium]ALY42790.1 RNA polymerase sigma24 factor [Pseudomonas aeruginosa]ASD14073.1 sigma-70 family RNA polymerase sigma factor [Pseudomonas aeruginosa]EIU1436190.1 sigma-70 family RNA polymerase sigma factor [Pseudomonas aeruginosa]EKU4049347.1 sigma-70 family RNA polymerase sigma factor [Pseudomonas aeruginosa]